MTSSSNLATVVWITGLPQSGKSTFASRFADALVRPHCILDGDEVREALVPSLGYSERERADFYATLGNLASLLARQGLLVVVAATANRRSYRDRLRDDSRLTLIEVFVDATAATCAERDRKGLYKSTAIKLPGVGASFEAPRAPEVRASGGFDDAALARLVALVESARA